MWQFILAMYLKAGAPWSVQDSLEGHPTMRRLYLKNNPLGVMGLCPGGARGQ